MARAPCDSSLRPADADGILLYSAAAHAAADSRKSSLRMAGVKGARSAPRSGLRPLTPDIRRISETRISILIADYINHLNKCLRAAVCRFAGSSARGGPLSTGPWITAPSSTTSVGVLDVGEDARARVQLDALLGVHASLDRAGDREASHPNLAFDDAALSDHELGVRRDRALELPVDAEHVVERERALQPRAAVEEAVQRAASPSLRSCLAASEEPLEEPDQLLLREEARCGPRPRASSSGSRRASRGPARGGARRRACRHPPRGISSSSRSPSGWPPRAPRWRARRARGARPLSRAAPDPPRTAARAGRARGPPKEIRPRARRAPRPGA